MIYNLSQHITFYGTLYIMCHCPNTISNRQYSTALTELGAQNRVRLQKEAISDLNLPGHVQVL